MISRPAVTMLDTLLEEGREALLRSRIINLLGVSNKATEEQAAATLDVLSDDELARLKTEEENGDDPDVITIPRTREYFEWAFRDLDRCRALLDGANYDKTISAIVDCIGTRPQALLAYSNYSKDMVNDLPLSSIGLYNLLNALEERFKMFNLDLPDELNEFRQNLTLTS